MGSVRRARATLIVVVGGLFALVVGAVAVAAYPASRAAVGAAKACGATVKVTDHEKFVVNQYLQDEMRFAPGTATVRSGCDLTFEFATSDQADPHSLSIVKESDLPRTTAEMESCKVCTLIKPKHVGDPTTPAGPKNPILHWIVNVGKPGLDAPGDSLAIFENQARGAPPGHGSVTVRVSAPPNTTLYFMCGLHPWMQGKVQPRKPRAGHQTRMAVEIVGREQELASMRDFIGRTEPGRQRSCSRAARA